MECHYKVLGVDLDADDSAIKKAYRKAALKYHPDKNLHCLDEATEQFRLVQAAYDVLSDPQERAWYDRHREEILHRKKYENYKENSLDLWEYFSPSAYNGFGDDENGFFAVYNDVFKKIDIEDQPFKSEDTDAEEWMPEFGDSESDYDEVVHAFYSAWSAYCTSLSFVWESQYDVKEAPNRRVARIIEKENKKERDKHKKKRNELVRELVSFVRKRDPRVKAHKVKLEEKVLEQAVKAEEHRASAFLARAEEAARYDEANKEEMINHHKRVSELENMMKDEFGFSSSDEEDDKTSEESEQEKEYSDELFCVACNKLFKSKMGLRNHEKSKKHKESMNRLKEEMRQESAEQDETTHTEQVDEYPEDEDFIEKNPKLSKKQKKQKRQQQKLLKNTMAAKPFEDDDYEKESNENSVTKVICEETVELKTNEESVPPEKSEHDSLQGIEENLNECNGKSKTPEVTASSKKGHNKKRNKQQTQTVSVEANVETLGCGKCSQVFPSRNKLFQHLKKTGHSLLIENGQAVGKRKNARNKR